MPIDPSIFNAVETPQQMQQMVYRNQLLQFQTAQAQRQMQAQNALLRLFQQPGFNPSNMTPQQLQQIWAIDPATGMNLQKALGEQALQQAEIFQKVAAGRAADMKTVQERNDSFSNAVLPLKQAALIRYQDVLEHTGDPKQAQEAAQQAYAQGVSELPTGLYSPDLIRQAQNWQFNPDQVRAQVYGKALDARAVAGGPPLTRMVPIDNTHEQMQQWNPQTRQWAPMGPPVARFAKLIPDINISSGNAAQYSNIQPDGKGGFIGFNKKTGKMEEVPTETTPPNAAPNPPLVQPMLSGKSLDIAAWRYKHFGQMPPTGWGNNAIAIATRNAVLQRAAQPDSSFGPDVIAAANAEMSGKATQQSLAQNTKDITMLKPYVDMLDQNGNIAIQLAKQVTETNSAWANKSINWLKQNAGDNPDTNEFLAQVRILQTEAARAINNPRLVGNLSDSARQELQQVISGNMPLNSFIRVVNRLQNDGQRRLNMMVQTHNQLSTGATLGPTMSMPFPNASTSVAPSTGAPGEPAPSKGTVSAALLKQYAAKHKLSLDAARAFLQEQGYAVP